MNDGPVRTFTVTARLTAGSVMGALGTLHADLAATIAELEPGDYDDSQRLQGAVHELHVAPHPERELD